MADGVTCLLNPGAASRTTLAAHSRDDSFANLRVFQGKRTAEPGQDLSLLSWWFAGFSAPQAGSLSSWPSHENSAQADPAPTA
jgi:hypothetical protein